MDPRLSFLAESTPPSTLPLEVSFEHRAPGGEGQVELHYWPHADARGPPDQLTLFILGNPGLLGYYTPFLTHVHSLLPPTHGLLATSHTGHSTRLPPPPRPTELLGLLEAKIELVSALRASLDAWHSEVGPGQVGSSSSRPKTLRPRPRLALMSHSVGGWLSMETMKRVNTPSAPSTVHAAYMICPTVGWIASTWNGWRLWPMFHRPVLPLLPHLARVLPPVLPWLAFPPTTQELLRSHALIEAALRLGRSEMLAIKEPDVRWFESQRDEDGSRGVFGCWARGRGDGWVGSEGPQCQEALGGESGGRVVLMDGVPHAFCLTEEHSKLVAEIVVAWMRPEKPLPETNRAAQSAAKPLSEAVPM